MPRLQFSGYNFQTVDNAKCQHKSHQKELELHATFPITMKSK